MDSYQIIDEPKSRGYENLILNPLVILFLGIVVPIFWQPPLFGRFWMPVVWLLANGYFLGSPTMLKEVLIGIVGCLCIAGSFLLLMYLHQEQELWRFLVPYFKIFTQAILFFTLYLIVLAQSGPFSIHEYIKEQLKGV